MNKYLILRLRGGLGNQLFQLASAISWAELNSARISIDVASGFWRDKEYRRNYALGTFQADQDFNKVRNPLIFYLFRYFSKLPLLKRHLIVSETLDVSDTEGKKFIYYTGLGQSHNSVTDALSVAAHHFRRLDLEEFTELDHYDALIHLRLFDRNLKSLKNISFEYVKSALNDIGDKAKNICVVSQDKQLASQFMENVDSSRSFTFLSSDDELQDLARLSNARIIILSNSTFSYWGAILGTHGARTERVYFPIHSKDKHWAWEFSTDFPEAWKGIKS